MKPGIFVVSLDFELQWGTFDHISLQQRKPILHNTRRVIPQILELFERYDIHATWATVGFLFCDGKDELLSCIPDELPAYVNMKRSPYTHLDGLGQDEENDPFHFAPSLINRIANTRGQEIGSHTLSHFYCLEDGATLASFRADLIAAQSIAMKQDYQMRSLVLPRNQYTPSHLEAAADMGFQVFRGNEKSRLYRPRSTDQQRPWIRLWRLADSYVDISGHHIKDSCDQVPLINIPSSRFLRPYNPRLAGLDSLQLRRIYSAINQLASDGGIYHIWWHPHNFGTHPELNLSRLEDILKMVHQYSQEGQISSRNMAEVIRGEAMV